LTAVLVLSGCTLVLHVYSVAEFYQCDNERFYVFDPHCQNDDGMFSPGDGACVLAEVVDVAELCSFISDLCKSLNLHDKYQYELIPLGISISGSPTEPAVVSEQPVEQAVQHPVEQAAQKRQQQPVAVELPTTNSADLADTQSASSIHDIGLYVSHRELVTDDIKFTLLTQPWKPDAGDSFPYASFGKRVSE